VWCRSGCAGIERRNPCFPRTAKKVNATMETRNGSPTPAPSPERIAPTLSQAQTAALEALLQGKTVTEAAAAARVDRSTVHAWLREHLPFQAALNRGRREVEDAVVERLARLATDAADCVTRAVRDGNVKAALEVLKTQKLLAPRKIGSDDLELLAEEEEKAANRRKHDLKFSRAFAR
jgi:hypothetical protein